MTPGPKDKDSPPPKKRERDDNILLSSSAYLPSTPPQYQQQSDDDADALVSPLKKLRSSCSSSYGTQSSPSSPIFGYGITDLYADDEDLDGVVDEPVLTSAFSPNLTVKSPIKKSPRKQTLQQSPPSSPIASVDVNTQHQAAVDYLMNKIDKDEVHRDAYIQQLNAILNNPVFQKAQTSFHTQAEAPAHPVSRIHALSTALMETKQENTISCFKNLTFFSTHIFEQNLFAEELARTLLQSLFSDQHTFAAIVTEHQHKYDQERILSYEKNSLVTFCAEQIALITNELSPSAKKIEISSILGSWISKFRTQDFKLAADLEPCIVDTVFTFLGSDNFNYRTKLQNDLFKTINSYKDSATKIRAYNAIAEIIKLWTHEKESYTSRNMSFVPASVQDSAGNKENVIFVALSGNPILVDESHPRTLQHQALTQFFNDKTVSVNGEQFTLKYIDIYPESFDYFLDTINKTVIIEGQTLVINQGIATDTPPKYNQDYYFRRTSNDHFAIDIESKDPSIIDRACTEKKIFLEISKLFASGINVEILGWANTRLPSAEFLDKDRIENTTRSLGKYSRHQVKILPPPVPPVTNAAIASKDDKKPESKKAAKKAAASSVTIDEKLIANLSANCINICNDLGIIVPEYQNFRNFNSLKNWLLNGFIFTEHLSTNGGLTGFNGNYTGLGPNLTDLLQKLTALGKDINKLSALSKINFTKGQLALIRNEIQALTDNRLLSYFQGKLFSLLGVAIQNKQDEYAYMSLATACSYKLANNLSDTAKANWQQVNHVNENHLDTKQFTKADLPIAAIALQENYVPASKLSLNIDDRNYVLDFLQCCRNCQALNFAYRSVPVALSTQNAVAKSKDDKAFGSPAKSKILGKK